MKKVLFILAGAFFLSSAAVQAQDKPKSKKEQTTQYRSETKTSETKTDSVSTSSPSSTNATSGTSGTSGASGTSTTMPRDTTKHNNR